MPISKILSAALYGPPLPGAIFGLTLAWASTTTITVQPGFATDSTNQRTMKLASALTKSTATWAPGNAGGLTTGTIAANTGYHWYEIFNLTTGAVDICFEPTATPLAGPSFMPAGYTHFRWIWHSYTNVSSQWVKFFQSNDTCVWDTVVQDFSTVNPGITGVLAALSVPSGLIVEATFTLGVTSSSTNSSVYVSSPQSSDASVSFTPVITFVAPGANTSTAFLRGILTNSSKQIRYRLNASDATITVFCNTSSWRVPNRIAA